MKIFYILFVQHFFISRMRFFLIYFFVIFYFRNSYSQSKFQSSYGGTNSDIGVSVSVKDDKSIIFFGTTSSFSGSTDLILSKINEYGITIWSKTYGGNLNETAVHFEKTSDGGFILLGNTNSFGAGSDDIYMIKVDSLGYIHWSKTYGGLQGDFASCVKEVPEGGYIVVGRTQSYGEGGDDGYIVRVDENGNVSWNKSYGTFNNERFYYIDNTLDQGFIVSGIQKNFSNFFDQLVVKLDSSGNVIFSKNLGDAGGMDNDAGDCIKQTSDGGYVCSGQYRAFGSGDEDLALTKIDEFGSLEWAKVYGNIGDDRAFDFSIDELGNIILAGYTNSFGIGGFDAFLVKVDQFGTPFWSKTYGYTADDYFAEIKIEQDGYIMVGYTNSFGVGGQDIFIVKTNFEGENNISCTNVSMFDNDVSPIELNIVQLVHNGGISIDASTITQDISIEKSDLLVVELTEIDSLYFLGSYEIPLGAIPSGGIFTIDGITSSYFVPSSIGQHLLNYEYQVSPGCTYNYEKKVSVVDGCKYSIPDMFFQCNAIPNYVCIPLMTTSNIGVGVIGLNYCLSYNSDVMVPTGVVNISDIITHGNYNWASASVTARDIDKCEVSINYTTNAPAQTVFSGEGELACVEFRLVDTNYKRLKCETSIYELNELHKPFQISTCGKTGEMKISGISQIKGVLFYKEDSLRAHRIFDDINTHLEVKKVRSDHVIDSTIYIGFNNDFIMSNDFNDELLFSVYVKRTAANPLLLKYRNGFDAFQMENIITNKVNAPLQIEPTPYVMIAADVDLSDKIRSNDISLLQEVIVKKREGFPQQLPVEMNKEFLDWRFIDHRTVAREEGFKKASQYPYYSAQGYCRDNVPDVPFYLSNQGSCDEEYTETYHAILLGDLVAEGSGIDLSAFDQASSSVTLDIDDVHDLGDHTYRMFFNHTLNPQDKLVSFDFALDYNESTISIVDTRMTVEDKRSAPQWMSNDYQAEELLFTSYSSNGYPLNGNLAYIDIQKPYGVPTVEDLGQLHIFMNGSEVPAAIRLRSQNSTSVDVSKDVSAFVNLYPNPTDGLLTVSLPLVYSKDVHLEFLNTIGQSVLSLDPRSSSSEIEVDLSILPAGLYQCLITIEGKSTVMKKVVVK